MRELILKAFWKSVNDYPDIIPLLKGDARWIGEVFAYKIGEAPDDEVRVKDEKRLERVFRNFLKKQLERIIQEIEKDFSKSVYQPSFWDDEEARMWEEMSGVFIDIVLHGIDGAIDALPDGGRDIINVTAIQKEVVTKALRYRNEWLKTINESTMRRVWDRISIWRETGNPLQELIKLLQEDPLFKDDAARARRFAITETTRLHALGHQLTYERSGYIKQWNWMTANDELVCPICREGHQGSPYPVSELYNKLPAHPNCRCWSQPIVDHDAFEQSLDFTPEPGEWY